MIFTKLKLNNFKSYKNQTIRPSPLNKKSKKILTYKDFKPHIFNNKNLHEKINRILHKITKPNHEKTNNTQNSSKSTKIQHELQTNTRDKKNIKN